MENYYKNQLKQLVSNSEYPISIQLTDGDGNRTKNMTLNLESIQVLKDFLQELEVKLKATDKEGN